MVEKYKVTKAKLEDMYGKGVVKDNGSVDLAFINQSRGETETYDLYKASNNKSSLPTSGKVDYIDIERISSTAAGANTGQFINSSKLSLSHWVDNPNLTYEIVNGAYAIKENGQIIGFTDADGIGGSNISSDSSISESVESTPISSSESDNSEYKASESIDLSTINHRDDKPTSTNINTVGGVNLSTRNYRQTNEAIGTNINTVGGQDLSKINQNPDVSPAGENVFDYKVSSVESSGPATPQDFHYSLEDSNIMAAKARNMGFTDKQIEIALGVSRWETGDYKHLAYGYNYGGVTGSGDLGNQGGYAKYSTKDKGMDAFLSNLKTKYFDQGMNEVDGAFARKYVGAYDSDHLNRWLDGVHGKIKNS